MTLSHFMSQLGERGFPLYKLLKKSDSSAGQMRRRRHLTSSRHSPPSHQFFPRLNLMRPSSYMLQQPLWLSSRPWWWNRRNTSMYTRCKDRFTTSARSSLTMRLAIIRYKSYFMQPKLPSTSSYISSEPPFPCVNFIWAWRNNRKPSHHREDHQVGSRAHGARHNLHPTDGEQVPGPGGLHG
jgi:hypothetical protein